jgi:hypothetical protein
MIPDKFPHEVNPSHLGKVAEKTFFDILSQINEPMVVMYESRSCAANSSVIDFLVIHKTRGIMIFEVKSGTDQKRMFKTGFPQAQKFGFNVKLAMEHDLNLKFVKVCCYVVMPNSKRHNSSKREGVYKDDLESSNSFLTWLNTFRKPDIKLSDKQYDTCLTFFANEVSPIKQSIHHIHEGLDNLTPDQARILNGVQEECYIVGPAGTGKTEIMIHKAADKDLSQQRKLIVAYNRGLTKYIEWRLDGVSNLTIKTYKQFLWDCIKSFARQHTMNTLTDDAELVEKAIQALTDSNAVLSNPNYKYDSIFIDEAQLLKGENWELSSAYSTILGKGISKSFSLIIIRWPTFQIL